MASRIKARVRPRPIPNKLIAKKQDKHLIPNIKDVIVKLYSSVDKIASDALKFYTKHELGVMPLECDGLGRIACAELPDALEKSGFSRPQQAAATKGLNREIKQKGLSEGLGYYHTSLDRLKELGENLLDQLAFGKSVADAQAKKNPRLVLEESSSQKVAQTLIPRHNTTPSIIYHRSSKKPSCSSSCGKYKSSCW